MTMLAALATLACALALDAEAGPAILGVVLCLSLSRSQLDLDTRGRIEAAVALPVVSLGALGVGMLLHYFFWIGAVAFVAAITVSIWLRRFGAEGRKAGSLIALPFVVILVTPHVPTTKVSHAMALALPIIVALLALFWVSLFHAGGKLLGWLPEPEPKPVAVAAAPRGEGKDLLVSTRMALQMGLALTASFGIGYGFFAQHWAWVVLTAFIVGSGNQGRLDVVYKSVLRVGGAGLGTVAALTLAGHFGAHDATTVGLILAAVFLGVWLRPLGYAWWALFITLALALLQGFEGVSMDAILLPRLLEIIVGALIGVVCAWFVLPVHSTDVMRRRVADALAAMGEALDPAQAERKPDRFVAQMAAVERVAPAFRAARLATRRWRTLQPADWVDQLERCRKPALALIEKGETPGAVRKAIGEARKSMREPQAIAPALEALRKSFTPAARTVSDKPSAPSP
ncbi:MAG TPA: FUSC family protein [Burkholderiaceae bacterium]